MRILFMGTPEFAVPSLEALLTAGHQVCGVFTQPDKPKNRGMKLQTSPVKECALSHNVPVFQPGKMRDGEALGYLHAADPELIVVAAYGRILPDNILAYPQYGCINVHSSLLPKYRGAAPINWAILNGEAETGVTIMHMASELDAGDIICQSATPIGENETAPELFQRLAQLGAGLLLEAVGQIADGRPARVPQDAALATRLCFGVLQNRMLLIGTGTPAASTIRFAGFCHGRQPWRSLEATGVKCFQLS